MAARTAALAMAASRAGSLVAGFYAGVALASLPHRDTPAGLTTTWASAASTLGAVVLVVPVVLVMVVLVVVVLDVFRPPW